MTAFIREKFWSVLRKGMSEPSERITSTASSPGSSCRGVGIDNTVKNKYISTKVVDSLPEVAESPFRPP